MREAAFRTGNANYFSVMGFWLLEQNNPLAASSYFKIATEKGQLSARYYQAIAETEADSLSQAYSSWESLSHATDKGIKTFAEVMKKTLLRKASQTNGLTDEEKYYFCRYKIPLTDSALFDKIVNQIADKKLKVLALVDRSEKWFALDETGKSLQMLHQISSSVEKNRKAEIDRLRLMLAAEKGDWKFVGKRLNDGAEVSITLRIYLEALLEEQQGNTHEAAVRYRYLANANDQFEEGVVAASRFFAKDTTDRMKNFSLLVDGLLAKPNSVKILKQHVLQCIELGLQQEAQDSLDKLRLVMLPSSFKKFIAGHKDYFGVENFAAKK